MTIEQGTLDIFSTKTEIKDERLQCYVLWNKFFLDLPAKKDLRT